jgi:23S rRNA (pseudouridine1915-N3)-methyltransferase
MRLIVVAVGHRMPAWTAAGFDEFARRMPRELSLQLVEVKTEPRTGGKTVDALMAAEAARNERGADLTTKALAARLEAWQAAGDDVALIVGGPDGLAPALKASAAETLRLSSLTLPHALVRPLLAEALYRAWSVTKNHPYHRE